MNDKLAKVDDQSEALLEEAFRDDPEVALRILDETFREQIASYIKGRARWLAPEHLTDIYQDTMLHMVRAIRRTSFDPARPLALVFTIAKRRVADWLRRHRRRLPVDPDAELDFIAEDLRGTKLKDKWLDLDDADWKAFRRVLDEEITELPQRQREVASAFLEVYLEVRERRNYAPLADAVRRTTGRDVTTATAKSAWHEARKKLAERLRKRGFDFIEAE